MSHSRPTRNAPIEMGNDAGVVDQCIDLIETIDSVVHQPPYILFIAHIGRNGDRFGIEIANFSERLVHAFEIAVGKNDFCARFCERMRGMTANPFGATRDDHYFTVHELPPYKFLLTLFYFSCPSLQYSSTPGFSLTEWSDGVEERWNYRVEGFFTLLSPRP